MKSIVKKIIIYSMIGILQLGIGTATLEASPKHNNRHEQHQQYKNDHHERNREDRQREENERHEREMQRRHYETEREWRERQEREKAHHEEVMRTILGIAVLAVILNNN